MEDFAFWVIVAFVALFMILIGVVQYFSKKPVGFFSNIPAPDSKTISNVIQYNKSHGVLWMCYGDAIMLGTIMGYFFFDITTAGLILAAICVIGVFFLMGGHFFIEKKYRNS